MNDNKPIPYNTGKVLIGSGYENVSRPPMTSEEIFWQDVLLGEYEAARIRRVQTICYLVVLACMFAMLVITMEE